MKSRVKQRSALPGFLAVLPILLVLAFVRLPEDRPSPSSSSSPLAQWGTPVRILTETDTTPTSARRLLSPTWFALPDILGFSAQTMHAASAQLNLDPGSQVPHASPAIFIPSSVFPEIEVVRKLNPANEYLRRFEQAPTFRLDKPGRGSGTLSLKKVAGFSVLFSQELPQKLFTDTSLASIAEKTLPTGRTWRMDIAMRIEPPGVIASVLCSPREDVPPDVIAAVSHAVRAWVSIPISQPVCGSLTVLYTPPQTPTAAPRAEP